MKRVLVMPLDPILTPKFYTALEVIDRAIQGFPYELRVTPTPETAKLDLN